MAKRRFIQINGELVEVTDDCQAPLRNDSGVLWGDRSYAGLKAPDGTDISSRSKHREYLKATGLTTTDDFKSQWARQTEARERYVQSGGSINRADIQRAIAKLQRG